MLWIYGRATGRCWCVCKIMFYYTVFYDILHTHAHTYSLTQSFTHIGLPCGQKHEQRALLLGGRYALCRCMLLMLRVHPMPEMVCGRQR